VAHICDPSYLGRKIGRTVVPDKSRQKVIKISISINKLGVVVCNCNPSCMGNVDRRTLVLRLALSKK
jgi:hypothetical protein